MPTKMPCPRCGSVKIMAVPDSVSFLCYSCQHEFAVEKHFAPLRICQLLSKGFYGRQWLFEAVEKWRTA